MGQLALSALGLLILSVTIPSSATPLSSIYPRGVSYPPPRPAASAKVAGPQNPLVKDQYIVVFKKDTDDARVNAHQAWIQNAATNGNSTVPNEVGENEERVIFPSIPLFERFHFVHKFVSTPKFKGYSAAMSPEIAETLKQLPEVQMVEQDSIGTFAATQIQPPNWGLARISQANIPPLGSNYNYPNAAGGSYVVPHFSEIFSAYSSIQILTST
ncbi:serine protease, partial [Dinochytrium kinnereticum]